MLPFCVSNQILFGWLAAVTWPAELNQFYMQCQENGPVQNSALISEES